MKDQSDSSLMPGIVHWLVIHDVSGEKRLAMPQSGIRALKYFAVKITAWISCSLLSKV